MVIQLFKLLELVPNECVLNDLRILILKLKRILLDTIVIYVFLNTYWFFYVILYPCRGYNDFSQKKETFS